MTAVSPRPDAQVEPLTGSADAATAGADVSTGGADAGTGRPSPAVTPARARVDRRAMAMLSAGHLFTDVSQGAIPALLPFLIARDHLSYASASALILAATISSSVVQPLFGHVSDRRSLPWLMAAGPVLGGVGVGLVGIASSYALTFAAVVLSGLGVAAFHPEASRFANYVSGERRSSGMSLFSVGGNIGFAVGPILVTPLVLIFGLAGTLGLIVPTTIMGLIIAREIPRLTPFRAASANGPGAGGSGPDQWKPFALLAAVISLRSFVYFGFVTFVPLYFIHVLGTSRTVGSAALTAMLVGGAAGTLLGGPAADRFGRRTVLRVSMLVLPAAIIAFLLSGPVLAILFAALTGGLTIATFAVTIVMGQEYLPGRIGVASGVTIGLSIGLGGVGAPLLGLLADAHGLRAVFEVVAVFPLLCLLIAQRLPLPATQDLAATATAGVARSQPAPATAAPRAQMAQDKQESRR